MENRSEQDRVILGVDTHLEVHVGAVVSGTGNLLGTLEVPTSSSGYRQLLDWAQSFDKLERAGVEGTGTYGAALAKFLSENGVVVLEVNRPDRSDRRLRGKSDTADAESAARAVLSGRATAVPKTRSGAAESMRIVCVARRSAVKARTQAINQLRALLVSAPQEIRDRLWKSKPKDCVNACLAARSFGKGDQMKTLKLTLRLLARRWKALADEMKELDAELEALTAKSARRLRTQFGVGPQTAAILLSTAGDNPERLKRESSLAALCGVSPLQASSGKTVRHRLNRGGDRSANNALWTIAMVRMRSDAETQRYVARRTSQGLSTKEIQRCLKRYIVRQLYPLILADLSEIAPGS